MCGCSKHYAIVKCPTHGDQYLTREQYMAQLLRAADEWTCPTCGQRSEWDDNYFWQTHGDS